jgi:hypothetical protein
MYPSRTRKEEKPHILLHRQCQITNCSWIPSAAYSFDLVHLSTAVSCHDATKCPWCRACTRQPIFARLTSLSMTYGNDDIPPTLLKHSFGPCNHLGQADDLLSSGGSPKAFPASLLRKGRPVGSLHECRVHNRSPRRLPLPGASVKSCTALGCGSRRRRAVEFCTSTPGRRRCFSRRQGVHSGTGRCMGT